MREIKFRGKPIEDYGDVNWFYGSAVLNYEDKLAYIVSPGQGHVPVHWESVVQYTGLRDKNGKEIYEGDIIRYHVEPTTKIKVVIFREGMFATDISSLKAVRLISEVIGNIYENPELLETNDGSH